MTNLDVIDIGTPGDETSGDTINEGGKKINRNFDSLWKTFSNDQTGLLEATLPYQTKMDYTNDALEPNSRYDVDTTNGSIVVRLYPASSTKYRTGDEIVLRDPRGTWRGANVALIVQDDDGSVAGHTTMTFRHNFSKVTLTCIDGVNNRWIYSIKGGDESLYSEVSFVSVVTDSNPIMQTLYRTNLFHSMKFLMVITSNSNPNEKTVAEVLLTDNGQEAIFVEYANINTAVTGEPIANVSFSMVNQEVFINVETVDGYPSSTIQMKEIEKVERVG